MRRHTLTWGELLRDRSGMSALELALIAMILLPAIIAVAELGNAAQQQIVLQQALRAGGQYAIKYGCNTTSANGACDDATNIEAAVTNALPSNSDWTATRSSVAATGSCVCSSSGNSCSSGSCTNSSDIAQNFITLTASKKYSGTFVKTTINASYVVRSQ